MIRFATVASACALAISSTSVLAAASSSATLSGLNFTLIDLNPGDGVAPSFSLLSSTGSTQVYASANDDLLGESDSAFSKRAGTFAIAGQKLADLQNAYAAASITGNRLSASGTANGLSTYYNATVSTGSAPSYSYPYNNSFNLSVSANTLLLIEATVDLYASATNPGPADCYYCQSRESASATASLSLSYSYSNSSYASFSDSKYATLEADAFGARVISHYVEDPAFPYSLREVFTEVPATSETKSFQDVLTTVFTNSSGLSQTGEFTFTVGASGRATTAAVVPEPQIYALALTGLSIAGLLACRRRV